MTKAYFSGKDSVCLTVLEITNNSDLSLLWPRLLFLLLVLLLQLLLCLLLCCLWPQHHVHGSSQGSAAGGAVRVYEAHILHHPEAAGRCKTSEQQAASQCLHLHASCKGSRRFIDDHCIPAQAVRGSRHSGWAVNINLAITHNWQHD